MYIIINTHNRIETEMIDFSQRRADLYFPCSPLLDKIDPNNAKYPIKSVGYTGNYGQVEKTETSRKSEPDTAEEVRSGGAWRGGHGLKICPRRLLHKAVSDRDLVPGIRSKGGGGGADGGGRGQNVSEGSVGKGRRGGGGGGFYWDELES